MPKDKRIPEKWRDNKERRNTFIIRALKSTNAPMNEIAKRAGVP